MSRELPTLVVELPARGDRFEFGGSDAEARAKAIEWLMAIPDARRALRELLSEPDLAEQPERVPLRRLRQTGSVTDAFDLRRLRQQFRRVQPSRADQRATLLALAADQAGLDGIDAPALMELLTALGERLPKAPSTALSDAGKRQLLERTTHHGVWRITATGRLWAEEALEPPKIVVPAKGGSRPGALALDPRST